jgi:hypothetical protein
MTGPDYPDAPPPEVPEEFAATYREAYRRALEAGQVDHGSPEAPLGVRRAPEPRQTTWPTAGALVARWRASRWLVPAAVAVAATLLVGAAYAVGTTFSDGDGAPAADGTMSPQASRTTDSPRTATPREERPTREATAPHGWTGPVSSVSVDAIAADCTAPPSSDAAGHSVSYEPENATDGKADTAWRCAGSAVGERLTLRLSHPVDIAEVGLIPGYAKTDPASGADRYAENNRITRVRWTLADGVGVVQRLDPDPSSRAVQGLRVPRTTTDTVVLEILAVQRGSRNATAISTIALGAAD